LKSVWLGHKKVRWSYLCVGKKRGGSAGVVNRDQKIFRQKGDSRACRQDFSLWWSWGLLGGPQIAKMPLGKGNSELLGEV